MNCICNPSIQVDKTKFFLSDNPPIDHVLPNDIVCKVFHDNILQYITPTLKSEIMEFISFHDCIDEGNTTELSEESFNRFLSIPCFIGILFFQNKVIGTMFSVPFNAKINNLSTFITTYTTFLCIHRHHRNKGLAMILIRAIMKEGYKFYNLNHGYYITSNIHHPINSKLQSWYRPINIKNSSDAGFSIESFLRPNDRNNSSSLSRQKIAYHVSKPSVLPFKAQESNYDEILKFLQKGIVHLDPSPQDYIHLCNFFDVYIVPNLGFFMIFPMTSLISSSRKRVRNANLALMVGDLLPHALWIASQNKYDLLYGWCLGDITPPKVSAVRGHITTADLHLEFYNTSSVISNSDLFLPLF